MDFDKFYIKKRFSNESAFTLPELLVVISLIGILASMSAPSLINWLHNEREKSYVKEIQQFIPLVIREARRWGGTCTIKPNTSWHAVNSPHGLKVDCKGIKNSSKTTIQKGPILSKHIFQEISGDMTITPKGQLFVANSKANTNKLGFLIGGRNNSGSKRPKCIFFEQPVGLYQVGVYSFTYNYYSSRPASIYNKTLNANDCR